MTDGEKGRDSPLVGPNGGGDDEADMPSRTTAPGPTANDGELEEFVSAIVASLGEGVIAVDRDGRVTLVNPAAATLLGKSRDELIGRLIAEVVNANNDLFGDLSAPVIDVDDGDAVLIGVDGRQMAVLRTISPLVHNGELRGAVLCIRDMTARMALEAELSHHAFHDQLTELANRALFVDRLAHAHARAARADSLYAVMFVDLDDFKLVNDSFGHGGGDEVLVAVAQLLQRSARPSDTVARFGGDEFLILLEDLTSAGDAHVVADRVLSEMRTPLTVQGLEVRISASIGVIINDGRSRQPEDCIQDADLAMYRAKTKGKGRYEVSRQVERADRARYSSSVGRRTTS